MCWHSLCWSLRFMKAITIILPTAVLLTGCMAHMYPEAELVSTAPYGIDACPTAIYEGRPVYLYGGYWYFIEDGQWRYYAEEPPELLQQRQRRYIQQAPPAERRPQYYDPEQPPTRTPSTA